MNIISEEEVGRSFAISAVRISGFIFIPSRAVSTMCVYGADAFVAKLVEATWGVGRSSQRPQALALEEGHLVRKWRPTLKGLKP